MRWRKKVQPPLPFLGGTRVVDRFLARPLTLALPCSIRTGGKWTPNPVYETRWLWFYEITQKAVAAEDGRLTWVDTEWTSDHYPGPLMP